MRKIEAAPGIQRPAGVTSFWRSEKRVSELGRLVAQGVSAAKIGDALGCSRNAVISKTRQLGLQLRLPPCGRGSPALLSASRTAAPKAAAATSANMKWLSSDVERLRALVAKGWLAPKIAEHMGRTQRAVCTKAREIGLALALQAPPNAKKAAVKAPAPKPAAKAQGPKPVATPVNAPAARVMNFMVEDGAVRFLDLQHGGCKFPSGGPDPADMRFCGAPAVPGRPYCAGHCLRAYVSPAARVRTA